MVQLGKSYLRYEPAGHFGVIHSANCNLLLSGCGKYLFTCCNEAIACWSLKRNEVAFTFDVSSNAAQYNTHDADDNFKLLVPVTRLGWLEDGRLLAAGYADGTVRVWEFSTNTPANVFKGYHTFDLKPPKLKSTFHGHKNQVSCLGFRGLDSGTSVTAPSSQPRALPTTGTATSAASETASSLLFASGGFDTDIVIWDALAESGVCRLRGHRDRVTGLAFIGGSGGSDRLLSCSKDRCVKLWNVGTQVCLQTLAERTELWSLTLLDSPTDHTAAGSSREKMVVAGGADHILRVFTYGGEEGKEAADSSDARLQPAGHLQREIQNSATVDLQVVRLGCAAGGQNSEPNSESSQVLVCQSNGKTVEAFRIHDARECEKRRKRRKKRAAEKLKKKAAATSSGGAETAGDEEDGAEPAEKDEHRYQPTDVFTRLPVFRAHAKIHGMAWTATSGRCALGLGTNEVKVLDRVLLPASDERPLEIVATGAQATLGTSAKPSARGIVDDFDGAVGGGNAAPADALSLTRGGHRNQIRAVAVSPDDMLIMSCSAESVKIWSTHTQKCVQTIASGYGTAGFFLPGNTHVVIATKSGDLEMYQVGPNSGGEREQVLNVVKEGRELNALIPTPDECGLVCGGADKKVTFFALMSEETEVSGTDAADGRGKRKKSSSGADLRKQKKVVTERLFYQKGWAPPVVGQIEESPGATKRPEKFTSIDVPDDVTSLAFCKDWLAVGMLDSNVSLYYADSLKHNLSLYGHKLPVLALDITSDQQMVASGSSDKTIKLWSTRFGNCHKSLRAHEDSVMDLKFVRETHYLVSVGKDKAVKTWDCDTYELIANLGWHVGEVWGLALSYDGAFIATGGGDRALRIWRRSEQQFFAHEEREKEMEHQMEQEAVRDDFPGATTVEHLRPTRKNLEVIKTTDRLMEILDRAEENVKMGLDATRQTAVVKSINTLLPANIYEVLLALPFAYSVDVLEMVSKLLESLELSSGRSGARNHDSDETPPPKFSIITETTIRAALILIHVHSKQLGQNAEYANLLMKLRDGIRGFVQKHIENVGVNAAAMEFFLEEIKSKNTVLIGGEFVSRKRKALGENGGRSGKGEEDGGGGQGKMGGGKISGLKKKKPNKK